MSMAERVNLPCCGASAAAGSGSVLAAGGGGTSALADGGGGGTGGVSGSGSLATRAGVTGSTGAGALEHAQAPTFSEHPITQVAYACRIFLEHLYPRTGAATSRQYSRVRPRACPKFWAGDELEIGTSRSAILSISGCLAFLMTRP